MFVILLCFVINNTVEQAVWTISPYIQCGSYSWSGQVISERQQQYIVIFDQSFIGEPHVALSTVGLEVDPSIVYIQYVDNVKWSNSNQFASRIMFKLETKTSLIFNRVSYLAVYRIVFPNIFIDYLNYTAINISSGTGQRIDSSTVTGSSSDPMDPNKQKSYICFIAGFKSNLKLPYDLNVSAFPIQGQSQQFNLIVKTYGNSTFQQIIIYRVVFENNLTVSANNGTLFGSNSQQINTLASIQYFKNFFSGLVYFNITSNSGLKFSLTQNLTAIFTNYTFENLAFQYFYMNIQQSCTGNDCNCPIYYRQESQICVEICGDGKLFDYLCDDGNTNNGDGCSQACEIENNYGCMGGGSLTPSQCYPITILQFISITKTQTPNKAVVSFIISPVSNSPNIQLLHFMLNDSRLNILSLNYFQQGKIQLQVLFQESSINKTITLLFATNSNPLFNGVASVQFSTQALSNSEDPNTQPDIEDDIITQNLESSKIHKLLTIMSYALTAFYLTSFIFGLFSSKLIAAQMISVLQISFYALSTISHPNYAFTALYCLKYTNGYSLNTSLPKVEEPKIYSYMGISSNFLDNFNIMFITIVICPFVSLIMFILSKFAKTIVASKKMIQYFYESLCDLLFSLCIFNTLCIFTSAVINIRFAGQFIASLIVGCIMVLVIIIEVVVFNLLKSKYKQFRESFLNQPKGYIYPTLLISRNILIGVLVGIASFFQYTIFIMIVAELSFGLYLGITKVYLNKIHLIRQLINISITCIILGIYAGYGQMSKFQPSSEQITNYLPVIVVGLLFIILLMNLGFICKQFIQKHVLPWCQERKQSMQQTKQQQQQQAQKQAALLDPVQQFQNQMKQMNKQLSKNKKKKNMNHKIMNKKIKDVDQQIIKLNANQNLNQSINIQNDNLLQNQKQYQIISNVQCEQKIEIENENEQINILDKTNKEQQNICQINNYDQNIQKDNQNLEVSRVEDNLEMQTKLQFLEKNFS